MGCMSLLKSIASAIQPPKKPTLSIIVNFYNMRREARRTLYSLSTFYQAGVNEDDYEVIAVDNGSSAPLCEDEVRNYGKNFSYFYYDTTSVSPAEAMNFAVGKSRGKFITLFIDGARILSPGVVRYTLDALKLYSNPVVALLSWHLGEKLQNESILDGYNQAVEDKLLAATNWKDDGYQLFSISTLAGSCTGGWFLPFAESNCLTMSRAIFDKLGGLDERFQTPGGGLLNLDIYKRACEQPGSNLIVLLGEGIFHQFHGGVATNALQSEHPWKIYKKEYKQIRKKAYSIPAKKPCYFGSMNSHALPVLVHSANQALNAAEKLKSQP